MRAGWLRALPDCAGMGLYGLGWRLARPVLRRNSRLADGFAERLVPPGWPHTPQSPDIWMQAASGGEARLASALFDALADRRPSLRVLVTTWTRQGLDILLAKAENPGGAAPLWARYAPFDEPALMRRAMAQANPRLVLLLETELWPGLLHACARAEIPSLILNGRLRERTTRRYACLSFWQRVAPRRIAAISRADASRFSRIFPETPCLDVPNIKFDLAAAAPTAAPASPGTDVLAPRTEGAVHILLASVREEEEPALLATLRRALAEAVFPPRVRLIIAPRHMHRVEAWAGRLEAAGLRWALRSGPGDRRARIVLWDVFGELPWLYGRADSVFVGGSLAPLGGQNFLEPLAAGVVPLVGPHLDNFAWALEDGGDTLAERGLLRIVPDARSLYEELRRVAAAGPLEPAERAETRERFGRWLAPRRGGTAKLAGLALETLDGSGRRL
jgi:3-deoxy-D-manno-octulosonic-acid transferase